MRGDVIEAGRDSGDGGGDRWRTLEVWRLADGLALRVYRETAGFPREEAYGLTSQLRRAGLSVATNIVEGYSRRGSRELRQFLNVGLGSLAEAKYLVDFSSRLGYLSDSAGADLVAGYGELGAKLWRFYEVVKARRTR